MKLAIFDCDGTLVDSEELALSALARLALSQSKPLWVLDEPFTALDKSGVAQLEAHLAGHCERGGVVVLTTHHSLQHKPATYRELDLGQHAA